MSNPSTINTDVTPERATERAKVIHERLMEASDTTMPVAFEELTPTAKQACLSQAVAELIEESAAAKKATPDVVNHRAAEVVQLAIQQAAPEPEHVVAVLGTVNTYFEQLGESMRGMVNAVSGLFDPLARLLDELDEIENEDGHYRWMVKGEMDTDAWVSRVIAARDAVRRQL